MFLHIYDFNAFRPEIEQSVLEATGLRLSIGGDLKIELGFSPAVSINDIAIANAAWATQSHMATIGELEVEIAVLPLFSGIVAFKRLVLNDPAFIIEKGPAGNFNYELDIQTPPSEQSSPITFRIDALRLNNGEITYIDSQTGTRRQVSVSYLDAQLDNATRRIEVESKGTYNQVPFKFRVQSRLPPTQTMAEFELPLDLKLRLAGATASLSGTIGNVADLADMDLELSASGDSIARLAALADLNDLPDPGPFNLKVAIQGSIQKPAARDLALDIGSTATARLEILGSIDNLMEPAGIELTYHLKSDDIRGLEKTINIRLPWEGRLETSGRLIAPSVDRIQLEPFSLQLADNRIEGSVTVDRTAAKPQVNGQFEVARLDLRPVLRAGAFEPLETDAKTHSTSAPDGDDAARQPMRAEDVLNAVDGQLTLRVNDLQIPDMSFGRFEATAELSGGRLAIQMKGPALPDIAALSGVTHLPELGPFGLTGSLAAAGDTISLNEVALTAGSRKEAQIGVSGSITDLGNAQGFDFDLSLAGDDAARLEKYLVEPWLLEGPFVLTAKMTNAKSPRLIFSDIAGDLNAFDFNGRVDVDWSGDATLVTVDVAANRFNLRPLRLPGRQVPAALRQPANLGPLEARVKLAVQTDRIVLQDLNIRAGSTRLASLELQGTVADLANMRGADLVFSAAGDDAANLKQLIGRPPPIRGAFDAAATIKIPRPGQFRFSDINLTLSGGKLRGNLSLDVEDERFVLGAEFDSPDFDVNPLQPDPETNDAEPGGLKKYVSETWGRNRRLVPDIPLPFKLSANSIIDIRLKAQKMIVSSMQFEGLNAGIKYGGSRFDLNAGSRRLHFGAENGILEEFQTIGAFEVRLKARALAQAIRIYAVRLNAGTPETVELLIDGNIADAAGLKGVNFNFSARGNDAGFLNRLFEKDFKIDGPFEFSGQLNDPTYQDYRFQNLNLSIADSDVNGLVEIDLRDKRPGLKARFKSRRLDIRPFLPEVKIKEANVSTPPEAPPKAESRPDRKVFSNEPFDLDGLRLLDADVAIDIDELFTRRAAMQKVDIQLMLENGNLTLEPIRFVSGNGDVDAQLAIVQDQNKNRLSGRIDIKNSELGKFMDDLDLKRDIEGPLDFNLNIEGPADSMAGLMGGLNGTVNLYMKGGRVNNRFIGLIYGDLGTTLLNLIKPVSQKDPMINLNCFVLSFEIADGEAKHAGLLDTKQTSLISAGIIDLKKEHLDIVLKSNPKQRLRIRGVGSVGLSLKELAKPFKLGGSLANPTLVVDPSQSAVTIGKLVGGFALLGPLGIAAALTDFNLDDTPPCERAVQIYQKGSQRDREQETPKQP